MSVSTRRNSWLSTLLLMSFLVLPVLAHATERSEVPVGLTWDLTALFPSDDAWTKARADLEARVPTLARFKGHLGVSADNTRAIRSYERTGFARVGESCPDLLLI